MAKSNSIKLNWDIGTGYDFFCSLLLMYNPDTYGLRPSWASGMRQRLPSKERKQLAEFVGTLGQAIPVYWIMNTTGAKDSRSILESFEALDPIEKVFHFSGFPHDEEKGYKEIVVEVAEQGKWDDSHVDGLAAFHERTIGRSYPKKQYKSFLKDWSRGLEVVEGIDKAFWVYYEMFFEEEEQRIFPYLEKGLENAKKRSAKLGIRDLVVELSEGIEISDQFFDRMQQLTLVPSFWLSPYIISMLTRKSVMVFGIRPDNVSLVPGEVVPDGLLTGLECLANPTRLQILRFLEAEELTATQISTKLRLRTPTVAHHLKSLRRAGLVFVRAKENQKEVYYRTRFDRLANLTDVLGKYIRE